MSAFPSTGVSNQLIDGASEALCQARALLMQPGPQNLDIACSALTIAITQVIALKAALTASPSRDVAAAVVGLRQEVGLISLLLEQAAAYHVSLLQAMIEASGSAVQRAPSIESARRMYLDA